MGYGQNNQNQERQAFSLLELNNRVKEAVLNAFPETCWVRAEMSDVRQNAASGHCYLEFIEKNAITGQLVGYRPGLYTGRHDPETAGNHPTIEGRRCLHFE